MLKDLGWKTLQSRRRDSRIQLMYNITHNNTAVSAEEIGMVAAHSKNKWCSEGPYWVLHVVPNTGPYLVLQGTPIEGASKDPHGTVL